MKSVCRVLCLVFTASASLSCGSPQYYQNPPSAQSEFGEIDGKWVDENGISSFFYGGVFETRASDTNEKLSEGTYRYVGARRIEIEVRSMLRGTVSKVNCSLSNNDIQLLCITHTGSHFFLNRQTN